MAEDIVTRLRAQAVTGFSNSDWTQLSFDIQNACDDIERMRTVLSELANRFSAQEAKHHRIIRQLEAERDQWQRQAMGNG